MIVKQYKWTINYFRSMSRVEYVGPRIHTKKTVLKTTYIRMDYPLKSVTG